MQALPNEGAANLYEAWRKPGLSFLHRPERPEQAEARGNLGRLSPRLRRRGTVPDSTNLFILLTLAERLDLRGILMCLEKDMDNDAGPNRAE